ncbi:MAG: TonB-dependent receptor [Burkholderiaceae bacterium]
MPRPVLAVPLLLCLSAAGPAGAAESEAASLSDVVVTATKQGAKAFDTPASVDVVDGNTIEREGLQYLDEVAQQLPNVYFSDFSGGPGTIVIRGMGNGDEESDVASVGVQIDGVPLPLTSFAGNLFDLDHVEVLRGPQNLLHGQGNMGGLIALRSRDPGFVFGGSAQFDYGSYGRRRAGVGLDLPLSASTAVRVTLGRDRGDGYVDNIRLGRDDTAGWSSNFARLKLLHRDDAGGELRLSLHHLDRNGRNDLFLRRDHLDRRESVEGDAGTNDIGYTLFSGEYTRPLDADTRLTVTAGASHAQWSYWTPTTLLGATNGYDLDLKGYHAEARVQRHASASSPFDWMAGFHLARTDMNRPYLYDYAPYFRSATSSQVDATTLAVFGEAGWRFARRWRLAAGLRLTRDRRALVWSGDQNGTVENVRRNTDHDVWLPQLTLEYRPDDRQFAWVRLSRGYKAAGFNVYATQAVAAGDLYAPEYANHVEIGYRARGADDRWSVGAVAFHTRLRDQQVVVEGLGGATMTDNAGRSHVQGIELNASLRPARMLRLGVFAGYVKAVYDEYVRGGTDYAGRQFAATPRDSFGLSVDWRPAQDWELGLSVRRIGKVHVPTAYQADPAYTLVDAHASWYAKGWTVGLYGRNLGNARYLTRVIGDGMGGALSQLGAPRTIGIRVAHDF